MQDLAAEPSWLSPALQIEPYHHPHIPAFSNAQRSWTERRGCLIRLKGPEGHEGVGELAPLPGFSPDALEPDLRTLQEWLETDALAGLLAPIDSGQQWATVEDHVLAPLIRRGAPALAFALETAWISLQAQRVGCPPVRWLATQLERPVREQVPLSRVIDALEPQEACMHLERGWRLGIRHFKLKVGRKGQAEHERTLLREVLRVLPPGGALRLDANGQLPSDEVVERLASWLRDAAQAGRAEALEAIEEPTSPATLEALPKLPMPVWLDESLATPESSEAGMRLLASGKAAGVVLKPGMLGGVGACLRWEGLARRFHAVSSASHCLEGPVGHEAACTLALLLRHPVACGLDVHPHLRCWPGMPVESLTSSHVQRPRIR